MADAILKVVDLKKYYPIYKGFIKKQVGTRYVVDGVDIKIMPGETVALIGESGCGKTVLLRVLLGIENPTEGEIFYYGKNFNDLSKSMKKEMRRKVQMIFQNAAAAMHPRFSILESLSEPLLLSGMKNKKEIEEIVCQTLKKVGLDPYYRFRNPASLSGGQRQRALIARALVERPELILADEPISALDVSLQAQVLNLLVDLQDEFKMAMLFVAHDLAVVRQIADYIMIMYGGHIVEEAPAEEIYADAMHPYTQVMLESAPSISKGINDERFETNLKIGDAPDPENPPSGCIFHPRCPYADERCKMEVPIKREISSRHFVSCHKAKTAADFIRGQQM